MAQVGVGMTACSANRRLFRSRKYLEVGVGMLVALGIKCCTWQYRRLWCDYRRLRRDYTPREFLNVAIQLSDRGHKIVALRCYCWIVLGARSGHARKSHISPCIYLSCKNCT